MSIIKQLLIFDTRNIFRCLLQWLKFHTIEDNDESMMIYLAKRLAKQSL